jgi:hypothetical protein
MKKPLRSSARGASFHTKHASHPNVVRVEFLIIFILINYSMQTHTWHSGVLLRHPWKKRRGAIVLFWPGYHTRIILKVIIKRLKETNTSDMINCFHVSYQESFINIMEYKERPSLALKHSIIRWYFERDKRLVSEKAISHIGLDVCLNFHCSVI